jgi:heat shock protein HtpX
VSSNSATSWRTRLHRRQGQAILNAALRHGVRNRALLAKALALPVFLTPLALIAAAGGLLYAMGPGVAGLLYAAILLGIAWWLRPRRAKLPDPIHRRADLPHTFALLDAICARLNAPQIDALCPDGSFNAYVMEVRGQRVLGLGLVLWRALEPAERLALLGHEVGHLVNNDPARGSLLCHALVMLDRWAYLTRPSGGDHWLTWVIFFVPSLVIELWTEALGRLAFMASQHAEYRADGLSAAVAGTSAALALLEKVSLAELAMAEMIHGRAETAANGADLVDRIAATVRHAAPDQRATLLARMRAEDWVVDASHPPTRFRIEFLQQWTRPAPDLADLIAALDSAAPELDALVERCGQKLMDHLIRQ